MKIPIKSLKDHGVSVGQKFGKWTVVSDVIHRKYGKTHLECRHESGVIRTICLTHLKNGSSKGSNIVRKDNRKKEQKRWRAMMDRCYNKKRIDFKNWGGRGITVSKEFHNPDAYVEYICSLPGWELGTSLHIDRIDNDSNYERGNMRWATPKENNNNRRKRLRSIDSSIKVGL